MNGIVVALISGLILMLMLVVLGFLEAEMVTSLLMDLSREENASGCLTAELLTF